jgi:hypothetical protein
MKGKSAYSPCTEYDFLQKCCQQENIISTLGVCSQAKLESMLPNNNTTEWTEFFLPEIVDIPCEKPDIETIDSIYSAIEIISQRVVYTPELVDSTQTNWEGTKLTGKKLVVEGILKQKVVYTAERDEQPLHSAHFMKPFSVFIIIDGTSIKSDKFKIDACIEDVFACRLNERSIFKNTTIFISAKALC